jgi:hypothetical protein
MRERAEMVELFEQLNEGFSSSWFQAVLEFRNFAHVGAVPTSVLSVSSWPEDRPSTEEDRRQSVLGVLLPSLGDPIPMCEDYGQRTQRFILSVVEGLDTTD